LPQDKAGGAHKNESLISSLSKRQHAIYSRHQPGDHLRNSGWWDIEKQVCAIDLSAGSPAHNSLYRDFDFLSSHACPCLVELERASAAEIEEIRRKVLTEILLDNFCALWPLVILGGKKAGGETR
jgi:hypothetical protein